MTPARPHDGAARAPSIRRRLARALAGWIIMWSLAVGLAVGLAAAREVDELLDDGLQAAAELLAAISAQGQVPSGAATATEAGSGARTERFAWQVVAFDGTLLMRSPRAPAGPWHGTPQGGFSEAGEWRLYGLSIGAGARMLYAAQSRAERDEARREVALATALAALAIGLIGHVWLRARVGAELQPVQALSERVQAWTFDDAAAGAGPLDAGAERQELQPVEDALRDLMARLRTRIANEQAFSAHAAHALRTPLAGIDVQLAVALRECSPAQRERLQRIRDAGLRLQGVVNALLGLFRPDGPLQRTQVDLAAMVARLPAAALDVHVAAGSHVEADPDLLALALSNLLDNAARHGAVHVWIEAPSSRRLRLRDDGPGASPEVRRRLQAALDEQAYAGVTGLGLMLADHTARAHGGHLRLPDAGSGFVVDLDLGSGAEADVADRREVAPAP